MSSEVTVKIQSLLWWISSIAVSVLCCSMLFVVFASYMVDIKASLQNNNARIESIEAREDKIIFELDALQKRIAPVVPQPVAIVPAPAASEATTPVITPPIVPAVSAPAVPEATAPIAPTPLSSSTPTTPEKK